MIPAALAYLFSIHSIEPRKLVAVALVLLGVALKLVLAERTALPAFRFYLIAASAASLLQRSPLWSLWAELGITVIAGFAVWEGIAKIKWREHRWFGFFVGLGILAILLWVEPKPYPMFSKPRYYTILFSSTFMFAGLIGAEACVWSERRFVVRQHTLLLAAWFGIRALACLKWNDYYPNFDVWWVIVTSTAAQISCLLFWIARAGKTSSRYSSSDSSGPGYPESGAPRGVLR